MKLLLSAPFLNGNEWKYIQDCLDTGWVSSVGKYVSLFEQQVADFVGAKYGIACVNGTAALHISLKLAGVEAGDYVILPNVTFIASANAIKYLGANPLLIDACEATWQMDLDILAAFLEKKTFIDAAGNCRLLENKQKIAAMMPVHVLGNMGDMRQLLAISEKYKLPIVEDATEALGSTFGGKYAGTFGKLGCFSFNGNKIMTTGGGGVIVTDDEVLAKRAKHLTTQAKSHKTEYIHDEIGYNYRLVNILAALGVAQLEQLPHFLERKAAISAFYNEELAPIKGIIFQAVLPEVQENHWLYTFRHPQAHQLLQALNAQGIEARPLWLPMNQLTMFQQDIFVSEKNVSDILYKTCVSIPCSVNITREEQAYVVAQIFADLTADFRRFNRRFSQMKSI